MKEKLNLLRFISVITLISLCINCSNNIIDIKELLSKSPNTRINRDKWLLQVGDYRINEADFIQEYSLPFKYSGYSDYQRQRIQNDIERKQNFIKQLEDQYLLIINADNGPPHNPHQQ